MRCRSACTLLTGQTLPEGDIDQLIETGGRGVCKVRWEGTRCDELEVYCSLSIAFSGMQIGQLPLHAICL
jgi:hypothetical protein